MFAYCLHTIANYPQWRVVDPLLVSEVLGLLDAPHLLPQPSPQPLPPPPPSSPSKWEKIQQYLAPASHLLVPVHQQHHWRLVVVDREKALVRMYDSFGDREQMVRTLGAVHDCLLLDKLGWAERTWCSMPEASPAQTDSYNCGPFVLWWAKEIVQEGRVAVSCPPDNWRASIRETLLVFSTTRLLLCPKHAGARHELRDEQGHLPNFSKLLGTAEGLRKTTKWVMQRGILGQFRGARDALYGPPLSLSPAQD